MTDTGMIGVMEEQPTPVIPIAPPERLVTRAELADFLGVSEDTVDEMRKAGMPSIRWGQRLVRPQGERLHLLARDEVVSDRLLTPEDLAERWGIPRSSVWAMSRQSAIPNVKIGRHYRYRLDQIEAFELAGGMGDDGSAPSHTPASERLLTPADVASLAGGVNYDTTGRRAPRGTSSDSTRPAICAGSRSSAFSITWTRRDASPSR